MGTHFNVEMPSKTALLLSAVLTSGILKPMRIIRDSKVVIFVRHANTCPHFTEEGYANCRCPKWLRWSRAGKQHRQSAGTRTWGEAEKKQKKLQEQLNSGESPATSATAPQQTIAQLAEIFMRRKLSEGIQPTTERKVRYHLKRFEEFMAARGK